MPDSDKHAQKSIVIDTYAWIEYFKGSEEGLKAKKFIDDEFELFTPSIVIAELSGKYRTEGIEEWGLRKQFIKVKTKILFLDENIVDKSGELKQELKKKFRNAGLADAIILAHSLDVQANIYNRR